MLPENIDISGIQNFKKGLNSRIWKKTGKDVKLKPEVKNNLLEIAKKFYEFLELPYPIINIYFTGSLANYNWTNKSDMDVHVLFDLDKEDVLLSNYIFAKKALWVEKHHISVYGYPVELFAKNVEEELDFKAIYSLMEDKWIKKPKKNDKKIETEIIQEKAQEIADQIDELESIDDYDKRIEKSEELKKRIKTMRIAGLESGGEFSNENLIFKILRNNGYLQKLSGIETSSFDKKYTLKEKINLQENYKIISEAEKKKANHKFEYGCLMLGINFSDWADILKKIDPKDLYNDETGGFGLENDPHCTLLFGFHDSELKVSDVIKTTKTVINKMIPLKATGITIFPGGDKKPYDVVKFDIESPLLNKANFLLRDRFPYTNEFPDYHAHATIAYVKSGKGKRYIQEFKSPMIIYATDLIYSHPSDDTSYKGVGKDKEVFKLPKVNVLKVENDIEDMTSKKIEIIKDCINFCTEKLQIKNPVSITLLKNREHGMTTAAYLPFEDESLIWADGRKCCDIARSIFHELVHCQQRALGQFKAGEKVTNVGGKIEDMANSVAGILVKDYSLHGKFGKEIYM